ncbi:hypothetical protein pb186bvf_000010 [Paramecium bursaria]
MKTIIQNLLKYQPLLNVRMFIEFLSTSPQINFYQKDKQKKIFKNDIQIQFFFNLSSLPHVN